MTDTNPQDRIAELIAERDGLRADVKGLRNIEDTLRGANRDLAERFNRVEKERNELRAELKQAVGDNAGLEQTIEDLNGRLRAVHSEKAAAFNSRIASLESDIEVLKQHNEELTSQVNQGKAELNQRDFNRLDLIKDHDDLIRGKNKRIAELKAHAELREKRIVNLRGVEDDLRERIQEQAGEIADLKATVEARDCSLAHANDKIASLDTLNANQAKTITDLQLAAAECKPDSYKVNFDKDRIAYVRSLEDRCAKAEEQLNRLTKVGDTGAPALDVDSKVEVRGEVLTVVRTTLYSGRNGYRLLAIEADNTPPSNRQSE